MRLDPVAWTEILQSEPESKPVVVQAVEAVPISSAYTRYFLTLENHSEPIPFLGKRVTPLEGQFYREISPFLAFMTPRCHFSYVNKQGGWVILDDVPSHHRPIDWTERDVERIIGNLANLHLAFWRQMPRLTGFEWLPFHLQPFSGEMAWEKSVLSPIQKGISQYGTGLSAQAEQNAGALLPAFERARKAHQILQSTGGWDGIIESAHLHAIADLLDDPLPMLYPLRRLPETLLHLNLAPHHWRITMFGDVALLDWRMPAIGPAVCDLVNFTEQFALVHTENGIVERNNWCISVETMVDSYLLRLYDGLYPMFNGRQLRQAIPSARCLHMLTHWLPWLVSFTDKQPNFGKWRNVQPYMVGLFRRFLHAYKSL